MSDDKLEDDTPSSNKFTINEKIFTGIGNLTNVGSLSWSASGFISYGSHRRVVIEDSASLSRVQVLDKHDYSVTRTAWAKSSFILSDKLEREHILTLASADSSGCIIVWNIKTGRSKVVLRSPGNKEVTCLNWLDGTVEHTSHFLLALYSHNDLLLWDTATNSEVWRKNYSESLKSFEIDPFDPFKLAILTDSCILFMRDFNTIQKPVITGQKLVVSNFSSSSSTPDKYSRMSKTKIKLIMKEIVNKSLPNSSNGSETWPCLGMAFNKICRHHIFLVFHREILLLDISIGQTVGLINLDKNSPSIQTILPVFQRDGFFVLYETGTITFRLRKSFCSITGSSSDNTDFSEIMYERKCSTDILRMSKSCKIIGAVINPVNEREIAVGTTEGRIVLSELFDPKKNNNESSLHSLSDLVPSILGPKPEEEPAIKLANFGLSSGLGPPPLILRMCPPVTVKNWKKYSPFLAVASSQSPNIQIYDLSTGSIQKDFAVHTYPVKGLEWASLNSVMSFAYQNLNNDFFSGSADKVRNELVLTDIRSGESKRLRAQRIEEEPISMIKLSYLKQYLIITFNTAPFELWDLKNLTYLRTMVKSFPPTTALEWSPLHNLHALKKKLTEENGAVCSDDEKSLNAREHFAFSDHEGRLYRFSVEGNAIKDKIRISRDNRHSNISCISWKFHHLVCGDSDGNLNIYNIKSQNWETITTLRGTIKKIRFAPGRGNMKLFVLHSYCLSVWDIEQKELVSEFQGTFSDIDWAASNLAIYATLDGCVNVTSTTLKPYTGQVDEASLSSISNPALFLSPLDFCNFKITIDHQPWNKEILKFDQLPSACSKFMEDSSLIKRLNECSNQLDRSLIVASYNVAGLTESTWETKFWKVAYSSLKKNSDSTFGNPDCDMGYDIVSEFYVEYHNELLKFHQNKASSQEMKSMVVNGMLCLGRESDAVRCLLETDTDDPSYYQDNLKACLVASLSKNGSATDSANSTIKLVATNLISEGKLMEGVELLCLIGKIPDACRYLQSYDKWDASLWLAKCRLDDKEYKIIALKYCEHCLSTGRRKLAILVYLSLGEFIQVLDVLYSGKMISLAAKFLQVLTDFKMLPDSSHALVLTEEISLAFARHLYFIGNVDGAFYYCDKGDEKGEILKKEFEVLLSKS